MSRKWLVLGVFGLVCSACSSDGTSTGSNGGSSNAGNGSCPDLSGDWDITAHCDPSLIGMTLKVTQNTCALSFSSPFDAFSGSVTTDGKITVSGVQRCTGSASASAVSMNCTPGTCVVKLGR